MTEPGIRIRVCPTLTGPEVRAALALADAAARADGAYPFSEHVMLHLRHGGSLSQAGLPQWLWPTG